MSSNKDSLRSHVSHDGSLPPAAAADDQEPTDTQGRLFQQKNEAVKAPREKRRVSRGAWAPGGTPRDKPFQLPDDFRFALSVARGRDPGPTNLPPLPKIVSDGELLFSPDSPDGAVVGPRADEWGRGEGAATTTRREKEVRIVETQVTDESKRRSKKSLANPAVNGPPVDEETDTASRSSDAPKTATKGSGSGGKRAARASRNSRASSGKSERSQTPHKCGVSQDTSRARPRSRPCSRPCSRPTSRPASTSTTSPSRGAKTSKRKQSGDGSRQRRKSRVNGDEAVPVAGTTSRDSDSGDSDFDFDSDSDLDQSTFSSVV